MSVFTSSPVTSFLFFLEVFTFAFCISISTASANLDSSTSGTTLPDEVFWDNDWPSDLISVSEFNRDDEEEKKILDFLPLENPHVISGQSNLNSIKDDPEKLTSIFNQKGVDEVEVKTRNGSWIGEVKLPDASQVPALSEFQLTCSSSWSVKVKYNQDKSIDVSNGNYLILAVVDDAWITKEEYNFTDNPTMSPTPSSENKGPPLLQGTVLFAQWQIIPSKHRIEGDSQPHLTAFRKTLVMCKPHNIADAESLKMTVKDANKMVVFSSSMKKPHEIPKHDGWIDLGDVDVDDIEFPTSLSDPYVIQYQSNLNLIKDDQEAKFLTNKMNDGEKNIEIKTGDGSWVRNIYLPEGESVPDDSKIQMTCDSGYHVDLYYRNKQTGGWRIKKVTKGQVVFFILVNNNWVTEGDLEHNKYIFGEGFYTATIEEGWVQPGMFLEFQAISLDSSEETKVGILHKIKIGGLTELIITAIDAGFLTEPRDEFHFRNDVTAQEEYFETAPVSRIVIAQYETLHLTEVMLPSGKLYTTVSDDDGGWHSGDMRGATGKLLISHGINLANYGISSSKGLSESSHPFTCALLTAHNTVGLYQNGRIVHGGSGGNGMVTLDSSLGNELSHEVGHNYGLGHYVGGFDGSVHRPGNNINSSWGWDSEKNIFRPNFDGSDTGTETCLPDEEECQSPYLGKYRFGTDSMAGGSPMWGSNRFTMYTPYVAKRIQSFMESRAVLDPTSSTGFRKFDQASKKMEEYVNDSNGQKVPRLYRVAVTTIVGYYDPSSTRGLPDYIFPAMHGAFGFVYDDDSNSGTDSADSCKLHVQTLNSSNAENTLVYKLTSEMYHPNDMNKFHINVATEDRPYKASIYCFHTLRITRNLEEPKKDMPPLMFAVHGIPFDTTLSTFPPSQLPSDLPSMQPSARPVNPSCSIELKKKKCRKDKTCMYKKKKCSLKPCRKLKKKSLCQTSSQGCKW
eukprot:CAMPEP_0113303838 /NCGR_PEP_ID=MMETSP0010_2-20120614/4082_1 /TAXON_ID=216773 ORGANISM="Corethron hystrix, Strain 308" /NCGR_SAMPLE_ID=MMETSP0010_2 /ASSEMBLY_ACC=CAM_ASM_000155 /LENGTH=958 /DNA_ID=CAMNT_0000157891 /DNA_START=90 /DNA_END=2963 /DNA_ORIENTATION=+ /assembly_acc=CAM_ASM_000155